MVKHLLDKLFLKRIIILLLVLILSLFSFGIKLSHDFLVRFAGWFNLSPDGLKGFNDELFTFLIPLVLFGFWYQMFTEKENREIRRKDVIDSIQGDSETLALFSVEAKMKFVKNIICSIIGERNGSLLYKNMIERYLENNIIYRENLKYHVEINKADEDFSFKYVDDLSSDQYYLLSQNLVYTKHFKKEAKDIGFKIVFAFDDKSLNHLMNDGNIFFREVINVDGLKVAAEKYTDDDFKEFLETHLKFAVCFVDEEDSKGDHQPLLKAGEDYLVTYLNTDEVKGIEISLKSDHTLKKAIKTGADSKYYRCKLSFELPFSKQGNRFHFALPEPTLNPEFSIRFDKSIKKIDYFTHFSNIRKTPTVDKKGLTYSITTSEIIYPRSGIMFFWDV